MPVVVSYPEANVHKPYYYTRGLANASNEVVLWRRNFGPPIGNREEA